MKDAAIRIVTNEKLTHAVHWTVFGIGALSLGFAVIATAASALCPLATRPATRTAAMNRLTGAAFVRNATRTEFRGASRAPLSTLIRRITHMSRVCELTGKGPMSGHKVSHANNKTKRRFLPNLNEVTLISDVLGQSFRLRVSAAGIRSVDHRGGLDAYLAKAKDDELSVRVQKIKKDIAKAATAA